MQRHDSVSAHSLKSLGWVQCHRDWSHNVTPISLLGDNLSYNVFKINSHEMTVNYDQFLLTLFNISRH